MTTSICVLCPYGLDSGLLSKATELSNGGPVRAVIPEREIAAAADCGATAIHTVSGLPSDEMLIALWLKDRITQWCDTIVLAPATVRMRNIMSMLAWHLRAGLTADCTALSMDGSVLLQTRPAFGNSLMATIRSLSTIQMATVRPGMFQFKAHPNQAPTVIPELFDFPDGSVTLSETCSYTDGVPLTQAQVIIAGGLGIGSREGFQKLEQLAKAIGGVVAASRKAVDSGFAPYHCQVGMTGVTVCPKLYIAVGISGAVQHLAGISGSEKIIAINSDPKAPILDYADYSVIANWEFVIDKLLEELS